MPPKSATAHSGSSSSATGIILPPTTVSSSSPTTNFPRQEIPETGQVGPLNKYIPPEAIEVSIDGEDLTFSITEILKHRNHGLPRHQHRFISHIRNKTWFREFPTWSVAISRNGQDVDEIFTRDQACIMAILRHFGAEELDRFTFTTIVDQAKELAKVKMLCNQIGAAMDAMILGPPTVLPATVQTPETLPPNPSLPEPPSTPSTTQNTRSSSSLSPDEISQKKLDMKSTPPKSPAQIEVDRLISIRKLPLVLDLDETLIYCLNDENGVLKCHENVLIQVRRDKTRMIRTLPDGRLIIFARDLNNFLKDAARMFELACFTAGSPTYAAEVCNIIDPTKEYFGDRIRSFYVKDKKPEKVLSPYYPFLRVATTPTLTVLVVDDTPTVYNAVDQRGVI
ncbi:RNA polymerase II, partial [Rhizoclosmatium hyalinum]